ncbi:hypothetical protein GM3709_2651 [Geminocystis sp. NIES-3709]|nr:hypothetical protein GM3709_2651 [Geminocystis sp. NIES-3709]
MNNLARFFEDLTIPNVNFCFEEIIIDVERKNFRFLQLNSFY